VPRFRKTVSAGCLANQPEQAPKVLFSDLYHRLTVIFGLQVTKLRNEKGLVEMEPYLVNGGRFAVHVWVKDKKKVFYPMPRIKDDIAAVEDIVWNPSKKKTFATVTESAFLEGLCWQVRCSLVLSEGRFACI
jgi:hypothetical protein